jgi:predicted ferric reductase
MRQAGTGSASLSTGRREIVQKIKLTLWGLLALLSVLWLAAGLEILQPANFLAWRMFMMQYTGILAIGCMSVAMILSLRPRWPEGWFGGLDKMYRLHKWLGIGGLLFAVLHWLWENGPKWATQLGLMERPHRGPRPIPDNAIEQAFQAMRHPAEFVGEWTFYAAVVLIALALVKYFPYRLFFKTHRLMAAAYLVLAFHSVILFKFAYWTSPIGLVLAVLLAAGSWAALVVLFRRVGSARQVWGKIAGLQYFEGVRTLEVKVGVPQGWPGHRAGQFAFATSSASEGAHPYTIASAWNDTSRQLTFIIKELGDHTSRLREKLTQDQALKIEGPYGCFTFGDDYPHQIWVAGGIGITPFVARMKELAVANDAPGQTIHLFHSTRDYDAGAASKLFSDAEAAGVHLHLQIDSRDGHLTGEKIREAVPEWREASIWFCGPAGFGEALRRDFAAQGFPEGQRFHQELFAMR